ncbi:MAG TPA: hydroxymethylglutaryl-CoA reductase [Bryobacteraceae bacterium]|nr:hydroxymethylglutaryl-CoA reductase [Bryobacteraceae bacterium]
MSSRLKSPARTKPAAAPPAVPETSRNGLEISDLVPRFRDEGYSLDQVARRRAWLESQTGAALNHTGRLSFDSEDLRGNIENPIGVAQVPVGVAGPILVRGKYAQGAFYVPMATSEGALVRSYERGMAALTRSGGVEVSVLRDENHISPSFFFADVSSAAAFTEWIPQQMPDLQAAAATTTRHGRLVACECFQTGRQVILDLRFSTGDAQGMNMIAKAADAICRWIESRFPSSSHLLFSGMCSEKRASGFVIARGKGKRVTAGARIPRSILKLYLHVTPEQLAHVWHSTVIGHIYAGSIGYNAHYANGLAAIFIATGQDVANVANSACGITSFELDSEGIFASVTLPALSVATIGGGTSLPTQREALAIMGCYGAGKARKFAEIVAAALLGGELSMGAAIAAGEFVAAHERYGRNRPK